MEKRITVSEAGHDKFHCPLDLHNEVKVRIAETPHRPMIYVVAMVSVQCLTRGCLAHRRHETKMLRDGQNCHEKMELVGFIANQCVIKIDNLVVPWLLDFLAQK
jgi:hypothetical protein